MRELSYPSGEFGLKLVEYEVWVCFGDLVPVGYLVPRDDV